MSHRGRVLVSMAVSGARLPLTDFAFGAAVKAVQAFMTVLPPEAEWKQQFDELVALAKPLKDRWEKEMG